jgi:phosphoribosyl-ATP pyrophosphohydrolase
MTKQTGDILDVLFATINSRKGADESASYTAQLLASGAGHIGRKLNEESVEALMAALAGDRENLTAEAADIVYHLLVLLAAADIDIADLWQELARREGVSGVAEKAARV